MSLQNLLNIPLVIAVFAVMLGFYLLGMARKPFWMKSLFWVFTWLVGLYIIFKYAIIPPLPGSIVQMFMAIIAISLAIFVSSDTQRQEEVTGPVIQFLADRRFNLPLAVFAVLIPMLVAWNVYRSGQESIVPPVEVRTIHPAPPSELTFREKTLNLNTLNNPYRELEVYDPETFRKHVENGRKVYYQNCVFCHGDTLEGDGLYAHGFNPIPADLADLGTIAILEESYVFWRIAKGGPGLPQASGPWSSAMPAWEQFLSEEETWDVILFLYDFTGLKPRARVHHE